MSIMKSRSILFVRSTQALIGAVIGVGIFGIPYVVAQSGFTIGLVYILVLGAINLVMILAYADLVLSFDGHRRLVGSVRKHLGEHWGILMAISLFGGIWGAMVAYTIIGGEFLHALLHASLGGEVLTYQIIFLAVMSIILIGGLNIVSKLEMIFVSALILLLILIIGGALPHAEIQNLLTVDFANVTLPFGVVLFAFGGLAVIPEMKEILGFQNKGLLRKSALFGFLIINLVYIAFAAVVVSVTGAGTSEEAILGLGSVIGDWAIVVGALIGLVSVGTSFLILGVEVMNTIIYDYRRRYITGWLWAVIVPIVIFALGARSFISVIGFTGGVLSALVGIIMITMYLKAKKSAWLTKRSLVIPNWLMYLSGAVLVLGMISTIVGVFY
ncbi:hypothetical protein COV03_03620 [Candidatus Uhrbacteria bacterium CG10_big_fil_rev_8_21_14_0_10_41_26]|nr:MAG: hypothetical protein COV03_03620 [Candidatus Uhrbacteria bacterium CG10_big_fil_rev_8_21_14_0_10_41_26]